VTNSRSRRMAGWVLALGIGLGLATPMTAVSQGMGGGMMGGGMMGGGTMGGYGPPVGETRQSGGRNATWDRLASYIDSNRLPCLSCHRFSGPGEGPAFIEIAQHFGGQPKAAAELAGAISYGIAGRWPGYPPMPGGTATPGQADRLASLILDMKP
jgi:cytochrome c551/c552